MDHDTPPFAPPLPLAQHQDAVPATPWFSAQARCATQLAAAALAVGRLDALISEMSAANRAGAIRRLALTEVEAMLWAQGSPVRREEIGRDIMQARVDTDLDAMHLARWALRRLEGQGRLEDIRDFLGLRKSEVSRLTEAMALRPAGEELDEAAHEFSEKLAEFTELHPLARSPVTRILWRLADLSPTDDLTEAAVWTGRAMAECCETLSFVPLGRHGRRVWIDGGDPDDRLLRHLSAVTEGAAEARQQLQRVNSWARTAAERTDRIKGSNPLRVIHALAAQPLMTTAMVEEHAGISRDTAERLLGRFLAMGLVREVTGTKRFRLWTAAA
ncbi:hypothetical protein PAF17_12580 [Paracoccus sp. Z330]|uniref:HTH DNA binding domain-containing protein n=1 Tax=Paracoccus onchidii TaxID=3017813 RepID=A0ABT4ZG45_9RHOB|nr:hypothetical protein [Paracoccus onchidii]MDB6178333.1 hypothetical protein [Paracoccus onchidii]